MDPIYNFLISLSIDALPDLNCSSNVIFAYNGLSFMVARYNASRLIPRREICNRKMTSSAFESILNESNRDNRKNIVFQCWPKLHEMKA
ncbi:hypothetical protein RIF29_01915 [Crotalaria pallida]|uniref:Uncharacterized protein n=1 Tax=Crotalaria pallida TaxID=3830 RepID=A0AAN9P895_CROPI